MNETAKRLGLSVVSTMIFIVACATFPRDVAQGVLKRWEPPSAAAARQLIVEYGTPDDVTPNRMTWDYRGDWKRTVVWNRKEIYLSPVDLAVMKQTVAYPLTPAQAADLLAFSANLEIDLDRGELSSRADREEVDFLTVNLADQVARGRKTVRGAQVEFARQLELAAAGKKSPYMTGILFPLGG